jgi:hypothetical protein
MKYAVAGIVGLTCNLGLAASAHAQSIAEFPQEKICTAGLASRDKMLELADVSSSKFLVSEIGPAGKVTYKFDDRGYRDALKTKSFKLRTFAILLAQEGERFYSVRIDGNKASTIDLEAFVDRPQSHKITCVGHGQPLSEVAERRAAISKGLEQAGSKLILRKDLDSLETKLDKAAPAQFSVTSDRIADNTAFLSQFALATEIPLNLGYDKSDPTSPATAVPVFLTPYVRHQGTFNSNRRAKDIDNLGVGMIANFYAIPVSSWLNTTLSFRGEYLTDTVNEKEILASEVTLQPFSSGYVKWPIELGQRMYFDEIGGGPSVRIDLWGRARYGRIENNGGIATLNSDSEYARLGYKVSADLDLGGSDVFAGLTVFGNYMFFHNVKDTTGLDHLQRFETGLRYAFTPNFGLVFNYEKGRNEDTLQKTDKIGAAVTIKFGDLEINKPAKLEKAE